MSIIILFIIIYIFAKRRKIKKQELFLKQSELLNSEDGKRLFRKIDEFLEAIDDAKKSYIEKSFEDDIKNKYKDEYKAVTKGKYKIIKNKKTFDFRHTWFYLNKIIKKSNRKYEERKKIEELLLLAKKKKELLEKKKKELLGSEEAKELFMNINNFYKDIKKAEKNYIEYTFEEALKKKYRKTYDSIIVGKFKIIEDIRITEFLMTWKNIKEIINDSNNEYIERKRKEELLLLERKKKELLESEKGKEFFRKIDNFHEEIENAKKGYIIYTFGEEIKKKYMKIYNSIVDGEFKIIEDNRITEFKRIWNGIEKIIKDSNDVYVDQEMYKHEKFFSDIDGKSLDLQQRKAIVVDDMNNLIIAGAGSGKTLTIAGKVKYLVEKKGIKPEEILLISFTRKSSEEMFNRINNKLGIKVDVKTFHRLGLDIIYNYTNEKIVINDEIDLIVKKYFKEVVYKYKTEISKLVIYFGCYLNIPKGVEEFNNLSEYHKYSRTMELNTLKGKMQLKKDIKGKIKILRKNKITISGERVKSFEEVMIANFLYLNGINYEYERPYPYDTQVSSDGYIKKYRPDFYLPDYDIYIEHFGVDRDNNVNWLKGKHKLRYLEGMEWKRKVHCINNTTLLETYSYYNSDGVLLEKLEELLKNNGVIFKKINHEDVFNKIYAEQDDRYFKEFKKLIISFIGLFKANAYKIEKFNDFNRQTWNMENEFLRKRSKLFIDIIRPIYEYYEEYLKNKGMIDFNDMINKAVEIIQNKYSHERYKYIIIDEYQDISFNRFKLIKAIRDNTNAKLMCVGDDWQSIYRFTGSDIDLFTNFEEYFGKSKILKIEKTYRNSQDLINVSSRFIMKNSKQINKKVKSNNTLKEPVKVVIYENEFHEALKNSIEEIVRKHGQNTNILLIGRNNFDIEKIFENDDLKKSKNSEDIEYRLFPKVKIEFLTAHRSKGLECENVIIINGEDSLLGFPNKLSEDPVLSFVLTNSDSYGYAEERRLFYVALTRTKNTVYIVAPNKSKSIFVEELVKDNGLEYICATKEEISNAGPVCPKCGSGELQLKERIDTSKIFIGCSNYPLCDNTYNDLSLLKEPVICEICGEYMVKREGKYGEFYGCKNYPFCKNTQELHKMVDCS